MIDNAVDRVQPERLKVLGMTVGRILELHAGTAASEPRRPVKPRARKDRKPPKQIASRERLLPNETASTVKVQEAIDSDEHPVIYFRQIGGHALLSAEEEMDLSRALEDAEVATWLAVLSSQNFAKAARETAARVLEIDRRVLPRAAKTGAQALRALDLDRRAIDVVIAELRVARAGAELLTRIQHWYASATQLREKFVRSNLKLVVSIARKHNRGAMSMADLIQEGNLGLMHAVPRFDYRRGLRFSTFATWWIRHKLGRAIQDKSRVVRVPVHLIETNGKLDRVRRKLTGDLGRPPSDDELRRELGVSVTKFNKVMTTRGLVVLPTASLDQPIGEDGERTQLDALVDDGSEDSSPGDGLDLEATITQLRELMGQLSPVEISVLMKRFGIGTHEELTFKQVGECHALTRERIRQIQNRALGKLRAAFGGQPIQPPKSGTAT